jgi:hypothetical protein
MIENTCVFEDCFSAVKRFGVTELFIPPVLAGGNATQAYPLPSPVRHKLMCPRLFVLHARRAFPTFAGCDEIVSAIVSTASEWVKDASLLIFV